MTETSNKKYGVETVLLGLIAIILLVQTIRMFSGSEEKQARLEAARSQQLQAPTQAAPPMNQPAPNQPAAPAGPTTVMTFSETTKNFGTMQAGERKQHTFTVNNTGSNPLVIQSVSGDGGINVDAYPTGEIPVGGSGEIKATLTADQVPGAMDKIIHINANTSPEHVHLNMQGTVQ